MDQLDITNRKQQRLINVRNFSKLKILLKSHNVQYDIVLKKVSDMLSNLYYGYFYIVVIRMIVKGTKHSSKAVKNFFNLLTSDITINTKNILDVLEKALSLPVLNQMNYDILKVHLIRNDFKDIYLISTEETNTDTNTMLPFCEPKIPKFKSNISNLFSKKKHTHSWHNNGGVLDIVELMNDLAMGMVDSCDVMEILFDPILWHEYNFASGLRPHDKLSIIISGYDYKGHPGYHKSVDLGLISLIPKAESKYSKHISDKRSKHYQLSQSGTSNSIRITNRRSTPIEFESRLFLLREKYDKENRPIELERYQNSALHLDGILPKFTINQGIKMMIDH